MLTETAFAKINLALFASAMLGGCAQAVAPSRVSSDDQACERTRAVLAANGTYRAERMASCWSGNSDQNPLFYVLRVNGFCRDPQGCGSVLMGWYAVDVSTGAVYVWDTAESQIGQRIDRDN